MGTSVNMNAPQELAVVEAPQARGAVAAAGDDHVAAHRGDARDEGGVPEAEALNLVRAAHEGDRAREVAHSDPVIAIRGANIPAP